ncbi:MAG: hypothetical protein H6585_00380 [Flavobacteriales bacterium]|nr:hypothetical protein [Flavobacteriales bacterium]MCB9446781.1 hypothetical protein [Flavobacteriales bacterium]
MTGNLAQLIALATYGNAYLTTGSLPDDFYPANTTFQFCRSVDFLALRKTFFFSKPKETIVAVTPIDWFKMLKKDSCKKIRLYFQYSKDQSFAKDHKLAGLVGGGGTWLIETIFDSYSDYWVGRWEVKDPNAPDHNIWKVSYDLIAPHNRTTDIKVNLDGVKKKISQTLTEIASFASQLENQYWMEQFNKAKEVLSSASPKENYYHKDLIVVGNYSLKAQQVLFAAGCAWVFGGMGSWNDIGFDNKEDENRYDELSAQLYDDINQSILAVVNSY